MATRNNKKQKSKTTKCHLFDFQTSVCYVATSVVFYRLLLYIVINSYMQNEILVFGLATFLH